MSSYRAKGGYKQLDEAQLGQKQSRIKPAFMPREKLGPLPNTKTSETLTRAANTCRYMERKKKKTQDFQINEYVTDVYTL